MMKSELGKRLAQCAMLIAVVGVTIALAAYSNRNEAHGGGAAAAAAAKAHAAPEGQRKAAAWPARTLDAQPGQAPEGTEWNSRDR